MMVALLWGRGKKGYLRTFKRMDKISCLKAY